MIEYWPLTALLLLCFFLSGILSFAILQDKSLEHESYRIYLDNAEAPMTFLEWKSTIRIER